MSEIEPPGGAARARVHFQIVQAPSEVEMASLLAWSEELVGALAPGSDSLVVRFTHDEEMTRLNESYRNRPSATDVLSFPGDTGPDGFHLGDVVIAVPVAERQAAEAGSGVDTELRRLVLHAVLHCLGYDHETDDGEMERLENRLRARWISGDSA